MTKEDKMKLPTKRQIKHYMLNHYWEYIDQCDEVNATYLAEDAALYFSDLGYEVYLDNVTYDIDELFFDCAVDVSIMYDSRKLTT